MIREALIRLLALPVITRPVVYMWHLYHIAQLNNVREKSLKDLRKQTKHLDISSDFNPYDIKALQYVVQKALKEYIVCAEIGSWKGMSTSVIAKTIRGYYGEIYAIDHWNGSDGVPEHKQSEINDMFALFQSNMSKLGIDNVHPMVMNSAAASYVFKDESLDFIFIDADHRYQFIKHDLKAWYPKLKPGGIISGHDCEIKYTECGEYTKFINEHLDEDAIIGVCHPGVVRALYEEFNDDYEIVPDSSVWWRRK